MCGIAGILTAAPQGGAQAQIEAMTLAVRHRGPDAGAVFVDDEAGVALGHRQLAILDLSERGAQPMHSERGRYVLTFNGEIYNHLTLRRDLEESGPVRWRGTSDTETLLAAGAVDVKEAAIAAPGDGLLAERESVHRLGLAARDGIKITTLVRSDAGHEAAVGRDRESAGVDAFRAEGSRLSSRDILHVEAHAVVALVAGEDELFAIGKPPGPVVIDVILGQLAGYAAPVGISTNWAGVAARLPMAHFSSGESATAPPAPSSTAGDPSVLRM